jgi:hypothetical protein
MKAINPILKLRSHARITKITNKKMRMVRQARRHRGKLRQAFESKE